MERLVVAYLATQALAGIALWIGIFTSDTVRSGFEVAETAPAATNAFFPADLVVVAASALGAWAVRRRRAWAPVVVGFALGGVVYPTAFLFAYVTATEGEAAVALAVMVPVSFLTALATWFSWVASRRWAAGDSGEVPSLGGSAGDVCGSASAGLESTLERVLTRLEAGGGEQA